MQKVSRKQELNALPSRCDILLLMNHTESTDSELSERAGVLELNIEGLDKTSDEDEKKKAEEELRAIYQEIDRRSKLEG